MAFSVSNVHCSRLALNNIVTQFFWATCFFFLLRALRSRRPSDWALAGLSAGLSEYFYYGTRLLPFILAMFMVFLLALHWNTHASTRAAFSCWPEAIFQDLVRCCFTSFGTQTSTWAEEQAS
jgi:hypothetical protein